jgi:hypothetical protein
LLLLTLISDDVQYDTHTAKDEFKRHRPKAKYCCC